MTDILSFFVNSFVEIVELSYFQYAFGFIFVIGLFNIVKRLSYDSF